MLDEYKWCLFQATLSEALNTTLRTFIGHGIVLELLLFQVLICYVRNLYSFSVFTIIINIPLSRMRKVLFFFIRDTVESSEPNKIQNEHIKYFRESFKPVIKLYTRTLY